MSQVSVYTILLLYVGYRCKYTVQYLAGTVRRLKVLKGKESAVRRGRGMIFVDRLTEPF